MSFHLEKDYLSEKVSQLSIVITSLSKEQKKPAKKVFETAILIINKLSEYKKITNIEDQLLVQKMLILLSEWENFDEEISYVLILEIVKTVRLLNKEGINLSQFAASLTHEMSEVKTKTVD